MHYPGIRTRAERNASLPDPTIDRILLVVRIGIILLLLLGGVRPARSDPGSALPAALGLGAIGSLVSSPLSWGHHYLIAWPAYVFVPLMILRNGDSRRARLLSVSSVILVVGHYVFVRQLGAIGWLGVGTALRLVVAIRFVPDVHEPPAP